jgi:hypothetical protein
VRRLVPLLLALTGCCELTWQGLANDPRARLERRARFAVLATTQGDPEGWGWCDPPEVARPLEAEYRSVAAVGSEVLPASRAPVVVAEALAAARDELAELGYVAAVASGQADLVLLVTLTTHPDGSPARVSIHAGGPVDGQFRRDLVGLSAVLPPASSGEACQVTASDLVRDLVRALPRREDEGE